MPFASQNEEKLFKKWQKESPFGASAQSTFPDLILPEQAELIELFRTDRENIKKKSFFPFEEFYAESFLNTLASELSEEQQKMIDALAWRYIVNKVDAMNKVLSQAYDLFDKNESAPAIVLLDILAKAGHPEACYMLAAYYLYGEYVPRDPQKALDYAYRAIKYVSHPRTCLLLAAMNYEGIGMERDRRQANVWVQRAEQQAQSDPTVYVLLAEYFQDGYIINRDVEKAAHYAHMAEKVREN